MKVSNQMTNVLAKACLLHLTKMNVDSTIDDGKNIKVLYAEYHKETEQLIIALSNGKAQTLEGAQLEVAADQYDPETFDFCQYDQGNDNGHEWIFFPDQYFEGMSESCLKELAIEYRQSCIKSK